MNQRQAKPKPCLAPFTWVFVLSSDWLIMLFPIYICTVNGQSDQNIDFTLNMTLNQIDMTHSIIIARYILRNPARADGWGNRYC